MAKGAVYIVEDDHDLRSSLERLLAVRSGWHVRAFASGDAWLDVADQVEAGCVLLDLHLPGTSGQAVLQAMSARNLPHVAVVLTGEGNVSAAVNAMRAGAVDFLEKPVEWGMLEAGLRGALDRLAHAAHQRRRKADAKERIGRLSSRETEVMMELVKGLPNKLVAYNLGLSIRTVEVHRAHIMEKMGLSSIADLLKCAFAAGMLAE